MRITVFAVAFYWHFGKPSHLSYTPFTAVTRVRIPLGSPLHSEWRFAQQNSNLGSSAQHEAYLIQRSSNYAANHLRRFAIPFFDSGVEDDQHSNKGEKFWAFFPSRRCKPARTQKTLKTHSSGNCWHQISAAPPIHQIAAERPTADRKSYLCLHVS